MAEAFLREGRHVITSVDPVERTMIRQLLDEMCELMSVEGDADLVEVDPLAAELGLQDLEGGGVEPPEDPVLVRLLPAGYAEDDDAAAEFRRLTDTSLRRGKIADAEAMRIGLDMSEADEHGRIALTVEQGTAWLRAMNDIRLALGVRLEITNDSSVELSEIPENDPRAILVELYNFLTWWQDSLVNALMGE